MVTINKHPIPKIQNQFKSVALLLQGGGALGAYQAGAYEALSDTGVLPDWVSGISIGAINAAIIAGNKPEDRLSKLLGFWEQITSIPWWSQFESFNSMIERGGNIAKTFMKQINSDVTMSLGSPGFFKPRPVPPYMAPEGTIEATSFYSIDGLKSTLQSFIDFDILNSGAVRFTTCAVNVCSGNYAVFDSKKMTIIPEHIMASGALPPGLPAVEIEGEFFWDGGLIYNTPLHWVLDDPCSDTLIFQVDLWSARDNFPRNLAEVGTRQKEIQYSSRTRAITNRFKSIQQLRHDFSSLYNKLPAELRNTPEAQRLCQYVQASQYNIVHLIYRIRDYEGYCKDFEFSRASMEEHWKAGFNDTMRSLRHPEIFRLSDDCIGLNIFDFNRE